MRLCIYVYSAINFAAFLSSSLITYPRPRGNGTVSSIPCPPPLRQTVYKRPSSPAGSRTWNPTRASKSLSCWRNRVRRSSTRSRKPVWPRPNRPENTGRSIGLAKWSNGCLFRTKVENKTKIFYSTVNIAAKRINRKLRKSQLRKPVFTLYSWSPVMVVR